MSAGTAAVPTGLERIAGAFASARAQGRAALMPYMMGGFPDREASRRIGEAYLRGGADLVELGVPFSDPLADGPVIHAAGTRALRAGATLESVLDQCRELGDRVPVIVMVYANMALAHPPDQLAALLVETGAAGAIIPDLPHEEAAPVRAAFRARGLALVPLVAPTTPQARRSAICAEAHGFVYVVSVAGVTGERASLPEDLSELARAVRAGAAVPTALGFGISSPGEVAAAGRLADGVIVGSRLVRAASEPEGPEACERLLGEFREALREAAPW